MDLQAFTTRGTLRIPWQDTRERLFQKSDSFYGYVCLVEVVLHRAQANFKFVCHDLVVVTLTHQFQHLNLPGGQRPRQIRFSAAAGLRVCEESGIYDSR